MTDGFARVARSTRGGWTENTHMGVVAVCTPEGRLVARLGDTEVKVFLRSGAKPVQLLPLLLAGGQERFDLASAELALMCASHAGMDKHLDAVESLLERADLAQSDLGCGAHPPLDAESARALRERGERPTALHNNCSANHVGQLMACKIRGLPTAGYLDPRHPLQREVLDLVAEFAGVESEHVICGIDGCGLPSFFVSASSAARLYAALADPRGLGLDSEPARAAVAVIEAMAGNPDMVSGPGRFTTELIHATGGRVIGKEGAEGFYGATVRGPVALGVAIKIADGTETCRDGVVLEVLRQIGSLSNAEFEQLSPFYRKELKNHSGEQIGELAPDLELVALESSSATSDPRAERVE